jgi:dUTP pyrophosphatase
MLNSCSVLSRAEILSLLKSSPPLLENLLDPEQQIQPNGVDITVKEIATISTTGVLAVDNKDRIISKAIPLEFDDIGSIHLPPACYLVTCNEIINLPNDIMALAAPRSSLLRCGASMENAVWDAGYSGRSQSLLVVHNSNGLKIFRNARFNQLVFFRLANPVSKGYQGIFQKENI